MATEEQAAPPAKKSGLMTLLLLGMIGLIAGGAGFAAPMLLGGALHKTDASGHEGVTENGVKLAFVPFDSVVVNVNEDRLTRFLRVKLIVVVEEANELEVSELVAKNKAILKNWLISHLSDKSMADVAGAAGINRSRREIQDQFNNMLFADGSEKIRDILFEEFNVQ